MDNDHLKSPFPATRKDVAQLKQTAIDAASDLTSTAAVHASKARGQLRDLASHVQNEGYDQLEHLRYWARDVARTTRSQIAAKPLFCVGVAFALGLLVGVTRRRR